MKEYLNILLIESNAAYAQFIQKKMHKLRTFGIDVHLTTASSLEQGSLILDKSTFDVLLLDLYLSDSQGLDTFITIQQQNKNLPTLLVCETPNEEEERKALRLGAQESLIHSEFDETFLIRFLHHTIDRNRFLQTLQQLTFSDELTGLYNRRGFLTLFEQQMGFSIRTHEGLHLFIIDLDGLKKINDQYGHQAGDQALIETAHCLRASFRYHDIIGRIGGDEFAVLALKSDPNNLNAIINHINKNLIDLNLKKKHLFPINFSFGITYFDGMHVETIDELLRRADEDLYKEKKIRIIEESNENLTQ